MTKKTKQQEPAKASRTGTTGAAVSPAKAPAKQSTQTKRKTRPTLGFPKGFYCGVATASYQIEGAWNEDGKGLSIWDTFAHTPGKMKNNDTGDVAIDHYHRYKEDVQVMKDIGAAYRISISWPRIFPNGTGEPNPIAPGLTLEEGPLNQVKHHAVLAHGLAVQAIRAKGKKGTKVGPAENMPNAVPAIDSPEHVKAAEAATRDLNCYFLGPMMEGRYMDNFLEKAGKDAPKFTDEDMKIIGSPLDFVGINVYIPQCYVVASDEPPGYVQIPFNVSHPKMFSAWHRFVPECLYWAPRLLDSIWKPKEIYITENGCAASDEITPDGKIYDSGRLMYLRNGLMHIQRAAAEGIPVKGNFYWSSMDNLEWTDGFGTRFGLVYVDFRTQKRIPKLSAEWFREAAKINAVA